MEGKNVGRSNETTALDQAISENKADEAKKRKKGYVGEGETKAVLPQAMLAHSFEKRKHTLTYPVLCQPKLDGLRGLQETERGFWSRGGDCFIAECVQHLLLDTGGLILDGELILAVEAGGFQDTMRAAKKFRPELSPKLEYHVFDCYDPERPHVSFADRYALLEGVLNKAPERVRLVSVMECSNELEVLALLDQYLVEGHEGIMIRSLEGSYTPGDRSVSLLKFKKFVEDSEYRIVDVIEGKGSEAGCAIFICETPEGRRFNVRPKGDVSSRQETYQNRAALIGRELTVKYQDLSTDKVPRFPVGIGVRDRKLQG